MKACCKKTKISVAGKNQEITVANHTPKLPEHERLKIVEQGKVQELEQQIELQNNEIKQLNQGFQQLSLEQIFSKLTSIEAGSLAIIEYNDFNFENTERISSKGNNGVVGKVDIISDKLTDRTSIYYCSNEKIAIKMMYNFEDPQGNAKETLFQKTQFDKEYCFPLSHPHWSLVKVFNYFRGRTCASLLPDSTIAYSNRTTYVTMELCESNLQTYIDNPDHKGKISIFKGILIVFQILIGIKHLYSNKVVHLDLKPDNILITNRKNINGFQVVIGDFGTVNPFSYTEHIASNSANRSPELLGFNGKDPVDIRKNDVWAAGCILFELLTGGHPFVDPEHPEDTEANIRHAVLPLRNPKFTESTKQLFKLLWNRKPYERIEPIFAVGVCGVLLFGSPTSSFSVDGNEWSSSDLENDESFKSFCADCKNISESICEDWLKTKRNALFDTFQQSYNNQLVDIELILEVYFVLKTPSRLFECLQIFSKISYP